MIDTHCHLTYPALYENLDQVLARATAAGVQEFITIGTRLADSLTCRDLAARHPNLYATAGIHPHHAAEITPDELPQVCALFHDPHILACGEIGLDYHYDFAPRDAQRQVFDAQLAAASPTGKPLVLHCRESIDESLAMLKNHPRMEAVFHCFTGTAEEARRILDAGYYLGFTGIITFKNTQYLRDLLPQVPADRLLLETDAPYLAPEPLRRQKINEPALIIHTFQRAAELRQVSLPTLIEQTTTNARRLFRLPGNPSA